MSKKFSLVDTIAVIPQNVPQNVNPEDIEVPDYDEDGNLIEKKPTIIEEDANNAIPKEEVKEDKKTPIKKTKKPAVSKTLEVKEEPKPVETMPIKETGKDFSLEGYVRFPAFQDNDSENFARVNFSIRADVLKYLKDFSKRSRISLSLLMEFILEDYFLNGKIKKLEPNFQKLFSRARFDEHHNVFRERRVLQLVLPKPYIVEIENYSAKVRENGMFKFDKSNLIDILLEAANSVDRD